jgi:superfamily II DNA or RNA helicase
MFEIEDAAVASTTTAKSNENVNESKTNMPDCGNSQQSIKIYLRENIILHSPPADLLESVIKAHTFSNPKYVSNEEQGYSNWNVDSEITTYRHEGDTLVLPRGYMRDLLSLCLENSLIPAIVDERISSPCDYPENLTGIELRPYQQRAIDSAMRFDQGVIVSPTGSGKSLVGLEIIRRRGQKALIILHRSDLGKQWLGVIKERMGLDAGFIGDGQWDIGEQITVAMVQTLAARENETKAISDTFGLILLDEAHHAPAETFFDVLGWLSAKYRYGLSATVERRDRLERMIYLVIGPAIETITKKEVENLHATVPVTVFVKQTGCKPSADSWNEFLDIIMANGERNLQILELAMQAQGACLVLTDRIKHAEQLSEMLNARNVSHVLAHGQLGKKARSEAMESMKTAQITIGTTSLLGEGLDIASWSVLILAGPISSEVKLMQAVGRVVRLAPGKEKAIVYDFRDDSAFAGSSFNKRFEIYRKHRIWVNFAK